MSTKLPRPAQHAARNVVMVTSAGSEPSLEDVALNLATVCAETGSNRAPVVEELARCRDSILQRG
jgi:hypothetical protein